MSKCDSCTHGKVCGFKRDFRDFEKEKTSGKYPKPDNTPPAIAHVTYDRMTTGAEVVFSVEVKCSQYSSGNNQYYQLLQQLYGNQQTGPFYKQATT